MRVQLESISINAMKSFRNHLIFFILFLSSFYAQAKLPECKSINTGYQNNCLGNFQFSDGAIYVGEFRNYTPNGIGTLTFANGIQYSGEFYAGKIHGKGIEYDVSGAVKRSGIWEYGNFVSAFTVDTYLFPFISSSNIPLTVTRPNITERERLIAEVDAERKKRLALEQQLAASQERERVSTEFDTERKKRQDLVSQSSASASLQLSDTLRTEISTSVARRIALVVGNANYKVRPLKNSRNDADDVSRSLKATGFEVIDLRDATLPQMRIAVRQFGDRLVNNDVGLVYYSGHGVEVKGRNYFIPVNADIQREDEIADQGLDVSLILEKMSTAGKGVNILIVDACRDDPFGRSFRSSSRGLANMDAPRGTIIAYATSPGKVASDGDPRERNSPYTKHLVKAMQSPNKPIEQVFKEVRRAVQDETKNQQTPWENTSLSGDFFFRIQR